MGTDTDSASQVEIEEQTDDAQKDAAHEEVLVNCREDDHHQNEK